MQQTNIKYLFITLIVLFSSLSFAQKTDTLIHINGNVMTGEIKKLVDGILYFKMDGMGTISVEAEKIRTFSTRKLLQIRTKQGGLIFGQIDTCITPQYVLVGYGVNKEKTRVKDIIEVYPIKSTFWKRISGNFDFGIDYAKSTNMVRANTSGMLSYRKMKSNTVLKWNTFASAQKIDTTVLQNQKADAMISFKHLIKGRWLYAGALGENSNSELGLDLRLFLSLTIQNDFFYTNRQHFFTQFGLNLNREYTSDGKVTNNPEALVSLSYDVFKHTSPKITLTSHVEMYPNLTFNGRWRLDTGVDLKYEVFSDFYIGFKVYTNFDSKPSALNAEKTDWGTSFSIGYSFH